MYHYSAAQLRKLFIENKLSAVEITKYFLKRAKQTDSLTGAYLEILEERALEKAELLDKKRAEGKPLGKLAAVPVAIKDNINIKGVKTTCASKFLENHLALYDASVVKLLEEEDAILIGKTNLDEFAMGSANENSAFKICQNPWDLTRTAGGSSGGSAAAVAARSSLISFGSDTGGSIRQPAAFSGIYGFKPSYGRVSRYGLVAFGSSLDQIGPFASCIEDLALTMEVIAKPCENDSTCLNHMPQTYLDKLGESIQGKRIGIPWDFLESLPSETKEVFLHAIKSYENMGAVLVDISFPDLKYCIPVYYIIAPAEASSNLARFDGIQYSKRYQEAKNLEEVYTLSREYGFGEEVKQRILLGTFVLSSSSQKNYFKKALKIREVIVSRFAEVFKSCDILAMPTTPNPAFKTRSLSDPVSIYLQDLYTIPANLAGLPAISIPCGFSKENLPFGLQLLGPHKEDARVLNFAYHFQKSHDFSKKIPDLFDKVELS